MKSHASMNRIYRLVWNAALGIWVAVAENAKGRGKSGRAASALLAVLAILSPSAYAEYTGAVLRGGTGSVAQVGNITQITQASQRMAMDFLTLSTTIAQGIDVAQPNAQAIALLRITGTSPSSFLGSFRADGQVFISNPNGILFGAGAQVNVGGLVATTLGMNPGDFMNGSTTFTKTTGTGSVVNQGSMTTVQGGYLALLAPEVRNEGVMTASLGTALLAAGNKVTLNLDNGSLLGYSIDQGAINALAENKQLIKADGGHVLLSAKAMDALTTATVNNTGVIEARTIQNKAGRILLMGDMEHGTVNVGGTLDASAPNGGDGGFIETSAAHVKVATGTRVTTQAESGQTGKWLIDPNDFKIDSVANGGDMTAATVVSNLATTHFEIQTATMGTAGSGDIHVNEALTWSSNKTLTLTAQRNININQAITATNGGLTLNATANGAVSAPAAVNVGTFTLTNGMWSQIGALPAFSARDFRINGGTFTRALGGDGLSTGSAYQLTDVYGLQGAGSAGNLNKNFKLANNIDASGTTNWNSNAGFKPIGDGTNNFTGTFDGDNKLIYRLTIDRPLEDYVGLFGALTNSTVSNVAMEGTLLTGFNYVGALAGGMFNSTITNIRSIERTSFTNYAISAIQGNETVGGLVGFANGSNISNSSNSVAVVAELGIGGLVGSLNLGSHLSNSASLGFVQVGNGGGAFGGYAVGGVAGTLWANSTISNSYSTNDVTGVTAVGGLVGDARNSTISNSYSSSFVNYLVTPSSTMGGLVGDNVSNSTTVTNSFWNTTTSGQATTAGGGTGKTTAEMMQASTFAGWAIDNIGGTSNTWRIYEGNTAPLLRNLLTPLNMALAYDGSGAALTNIGAYSTPGGADASKLFGTAAAPGALTLASSGAADTYLASAPVSGQYSNQGGYDILPTASRTINTPGSAAGDVRLDNAVNYTNGALNISAANNIDLNNKAINGGADGKLSLSAGSTIANAGAVSVDMFDLQAGTWNQVNGTLPTFAADDFRISGGTFIRALAGDGTDATHAYQITDVYGLQGAGSAGMLSNHYKLANNIDASGTSNWNSLAGFKPIGDDNTNAFSGTFDGNNKVISSLTIDRPATDFVGLFGALSNATVSNLGLAAVSVNGGNYVGALAGSVDGSAISNSYATGSVSGASSVGGLVGKSNNSTVSSSYAAVNVNGLFDVGGLVGTSQDSAISNSYASGDVDGATSVGGLVGYSQNTSISNSYATGVATGTTAVGSLIGDFQSGSVSASFWQAGTWSGLYANNGTVDALSRGLTNAEFTSASTFTAAGWNASNIGGDGSTWRIYEGYTGPLLRSFLTQANILMPDYDGSATAQTSIGSYTVVGTVPDPGKLFGSADMTGTLSLSSSGVADTYYARVNAKGLYSNQQGYDIGGTRIINTAGSAAGDVRIDNNISYTSGTLAMAAANNIDLNNKTLTSTGGTLQISGGTAINAGAVDVDKFNMAGGTWSQVGGTPAAFVARDFGISGGTFIRALAGDGTNATNAYQITDIYGLQGVGSSSMLGNYHKLANNIDATSASQWNGGAGFKSIGALLTKFTGSFDGQNHTISGLTIARPNEYSIGLFGVTDVGASISNVGLVGGSMTGNSRVGALVGLNDGSVSNSYATADVTGNRFVGGLIGTHRNGDVSNSYATGTVNGNSNVGGLIGAAGNLFSGPITDPTVSNSYATGIVTTAYDYAGGLIGYSYRGVISNSHATGNVNGLYQLGGLIGRSNLSTISNAYSIGAVGAVTGIDSIGGLVGSNIGGSISNAYSTSIVNGHNYVGGLVGFNSAAGGTVSSISNSYATGNVTGNNYVGGLIGRTIRSDVSNSYATGNVTGSDSLGGLIGYNGYGGSGGTISNSYATGNVTGASSVGGLIGYSEDGAITNSYATKGTVAGSGVDVGGLVGATNGNVLVNDSFWNTTTSGQATSAGGTGISDGYMKEASTFTNWSIASTGGSTAVWRIYAGYTSPLLRSFLTPLLVQPTYDGSGAALNIAGSLALPAGTDMSKISGSVIDGTTLTLTSNGLAGSYTASASTWGLYSGQQGYDMSSAVRTISTPGSAVGDIKLGNNISFTDGTLAMSATGNIDLNGKAITGSGSNSFLQINSGTAINAGAVSVDSFVMMDGTWSQVAPTLPGFAARDFSLWGGTFIRAKGGDGSTLTPYQIADVYGLQGVDSVGMADKHYKLANNIDASGTAAWNYGLGFTPIGTVAGSFTGTFDGMGHAISGLSIDRPGTDLVGLFRATSGSAAIRNLGLVGGSVKGANQVGALVGRNQTSITGSYASTDVTGIGDVGGLVGLSIYGSISDSHADGVVNGAGSVGGLVGYSLVSAISHSYATGNVIGRDYVGGLIGKNGYYNTTGSISDSYATGNVTGRHRLGGLVGGHLSNTITNSYATGTVNGSGSGIGGLVGELSYATVSNSYYGTGSVTGSSDTGGLVGTNDSGVVTNSFWDKQTSGQTSSAGSASSAGKTTAEMRMASTYTDAGWSASNVGGDGSTWRIYEDNTTPLLRSFLTAYNLTPTFDGGISSPANIGAYTVPSGVDPKLLGTAVSNDTLALASTGTANTYSATSSASGHYSIQQGYDISATRTITTSGHAAGDIKLDNNISFTDGALVLSATGNINLNGKAITGSNGFMLINGGTAINAGAVSVDAFVMVDGTWSQSAPTLPTFAARDFTIAGGTFIRAKGGDGSTTTPYQIADIYGLQGAGSRGMLGNHYKLANNIDASGTSAWNNLAGFNPIGDAYNNFTGTFDGNNKTINSLTIDRATTDNVGLFAATSTSASISNLGLVGGSVAGNSNVGALVGVNQGSISGSYASTNVTGAGDSIGGLTGFNGDGTSTGGAISNSYAAGSVTGGTQVGGLIGINSGAVISNSYASGQVTATGYYAGGLIGYNTDGGVINNSHATGQVTATGYYAGGLIGYNASGGSAVTNSYATGNVTGLESVGGLIGYTELSTITNSYATGRVIATRRTAGGLVGTINAYGTDVVSNSYSTGDVSGASDIGGLVGDNDSGIRNSYSTGNVNGNTRIGGLLGSNSGGIVNTYSTGRANGVNSTGGLVGFNNYGSISNSYSTGSVNNGSASIDVGGLVGVGRNYSGSVSDSFWDVTKSGQATSGGGTGKTTAQMMQAATFTGWDMANAGGSTAVWRIYEGHTGPLLRSFLTARTLADTTLTYNGSTQTATAAGALITDASGRNAGAYASYSTQQGYDLSGGDLVINKASLVLAAVTDSKTYDGNATSTAAVVKTGLMTGDSVTSLSQSFGSKNALGTGVSTLAVNAGYVLNDSNSGGNYNVILTAVNNGTINKATVSVTGVAASNKTYNGTDAATLSNVGTLSGLVSGEALTLSQSAATFDNKNFGIGKVVTATGYGIANGTGGLASNYQLASTSATTSANVDKAALTVTANAVTRDYNGTTAATGAGTVSTLAGAAALETVNSAGSQAFVDKNAGMAKTVNASGVTIKDAGNLDVTGNYDITYVANSSSVINKVTLSVTGVAANDKTYNGTDVATLSSIGTLSGLVGVETLALSQSAATFDNKNFGIGKVVTATGYSIANGAGGLASNYQLASTSATTSANIDKAALTVTANAVTKTYDSTLAATGNGTAGALAGSAAGEVVNAVGTQAFLDKNFGIANKTVRASGVTIKDSSNADVTGNYTITYADNTASTINKATLNITATPANKEYDGTTMATASYTDNRIAGDVLTYSTTSSFADKNVANGIVVTVGAITTSGPDSVNYTVGTSTVVGNTANITPKTLTVTANDATHQGGTPYSGGNGVVYTGFVAGETPTVLTGAVAYSGDSQGASNGGQYDITPGGQAARNYSLNFVEGTLTVTPADAAMAALGGNKALVDGYATVQSSLKITVDIGSVGGGGGASPTQMLNDMADAAGGTGGGTGGVIGLGTTDN